MLPCVKLHGNYYTSNIPSGIYFKLKNTPKRNEAH